MATTHKSLPSWVALIVWAALTCVISNLVTFMFQFVGFNTWISLSKPVSGATHIRDADGGNVWVDADDGNLYTLNIYCLDNENCKQWIVTNSSTEIDPFQCRPIKRASECTSLKDLFFPNNPLTGEIKECVVANTCFPSPENGAETWFALMSDGSVKYWQNGTGVFGFYIPLICSKIVVPIVTGIIVSAIYQDKKREWKSVRLTPRASDAGDSGAPTASIILASSRFTSGSQAESTPHINDMLFKCKARWR